MSTDILISSSSELLRIPVGAVVCITADGNYSVISTADGFEYVVTMQLGQIERRIAEKISPSDNSFIRIGKSLIINRTFITFINPSRQKLILSDCRTFKKEVSASRDALKALKDYLEEKEDAE